MTIDPLKITIRDLFEGYKDSRNLGVEAYGGKLDIRPPYQREFIYKDKQRDAVIESVINQYPLNIMYWAEREDGTFEVLDGQQRTLSICKYLNNDFSMPIGSFKQPRSFHKLQADEGDQILNYPLLVYICKGAPSKKLKWFQTINIPGTQLTPQEMRNAVYFGPWLTDAKKDFSQIGCRAHSLGGKYLSGDVIRQTYLETALKWISDGNVEEYMAEHQGDDNARELWSYFKNVIAWVDKVFTDKRKKHMVGVNWGDLYNKYGHVDFDPKEVEKVIGPRFIDDEITTPKGIFAHFLTGEEKHLNLRQFTEQQKLIAYEKQKGICPKCKEHFEFDQMHGDHKKAWSNGGKTEPDNLEMLCRKDNLSKSNK